VDISAVFFDAGETLVHPHPSFAELFSLVLRREGHDVDATTVNDRILVISDRFKQAALDEELWTTSPERSRSFWLSVYDIFLEALGLPRHDGLGDVLYSEFTDVANYSLFEDVPPVLRRLRAAGLTLGVVSNFEEWLEGLLEELGVRDEFDVRVISGIEGMEKPDPRIFRLALERAGVRAEESVYVGDNPHFDVEPAAAVGMFPVLIDRRGRHPDHPGARVDTMADLLPLLGVHEATVPGR
jgi:putative hydrolase of the HAD superfamily